MLIFTAKKKLKGGRYFPFTAIQRFSVAASLFSSLLAFVSSFLQLICKVIKFEVMDIDLEAKRIENGIYVGPIEALTFEGRFSWKNRIPSFIFECIRIEIGPLKPLEISLGQKDDREPSTKDPFFIWFYMDEEIAVARGKSGGQHSGAYVAVSHLILVLGS
ncbi:hypothetical protein FEM48_Zijuj05G0092600 [Ziziphus jujuba var. spinosa]|uniref:Uncharacterized protein n=1 Tax=Ziziphus jujuba var. spinosa TaxID=714518 RepID=A0A978VE42_ZIZJJ|nr:hypothetical protein FEM48_Zijuj05G0092600 [Ziziphus jujuba var. spinosa]